MADDTVYVCSEGRPWRKNSSGGFERMRATSASEVSPDRVVTINGHKFIKAPPGAKPKPYDEKNGF